MRIYLDYVSQETNTVFGTWWVSTDLKKNQTVTSLAFMIPYYPGSIPFDLCIFYRLPSLGSPLEIRAHFVGI